LPVAVARLTPFLRDFPAIVAGDFNRSLGGRRDDGRPVVTALARRLDELGFASAYHRHRGVSRGAEAEPTFCRYRRLPGSHHPDHVFLDRATAAGLLGVEVGRADHWVGVSDHLPVVVDLDAARIRAGPRRS
jgi:endonuclease/exonuclease/phosphatase family metal-dependent hydrolase